MPRSGRDEVRENFHQTHFVGAFGKNEPCKSRAHGSLPKSMLVTTIINNRAFAIINRNLALCEANVMLTLTLISLIYATLILFYLGSSGPFCVSFRRRYHDRCAVAVWKDHFTESTFHRCLKSFHT